MFQNYDDICDPTKAKDRVRLLRAELKKLDLDGFWVPHTDEHQSEYLPPHAERLYWLSGFSGSAGAAIVLKAKAAVFTDGRYTLQVREQVDAETFDIQHLIEQPPLQWLEKNLKKGQRFGFDPDLHSQTSADSLTRICDKKGAELVPVKSNLIDAIWNDQPARPTAPVVPHPLKFAGIAADKKLEQIAGILKAENQDAFILTLADSLCWTFNIRGHDVSHTPLALGYAILKARGKAEIFFDPAKISAKTKTYLEKFATLSPVEKLGPALEKLGKAKKTVRLDPKATSYAITQQLKSAGAVLKLGDDPVINLKAIKNSAEITGTQTAHLRDGIAYCQFLAWLDTHPTPTKLTEISVSQKLEEFREATGELRDISFDTISGFGPNGAIVHYRVTQASNLTFKKGSLYLIDSGAQYRDGTTDITRTLVVGRPRAEIRKHFTLVLKGHISLACAIFPKGTTGSHLDVLARAALWRNGLDFDHGTGHGVGSYLSVHEGPQNISRVMRNVSLKPGMIVSNEPGYYKAGHYGIRIENLVLVTEHKNIPDGERDMLKFETLSWAPIERKLIDKKLLSAEELKWLNAYHAEVYARISPSLKGKDKSWLKQACAAIR